MSANIGSAVAVLPDRVLRLCLVVTSILTLSAVRTPQAGQYTCTVSVEGTILTNSTAVDTTASSK